MAVRTSTRWLVANLLLWWPWMFENWKGKPKEWNSFGGMAENRQNHIESRQWFRYSSLLQLAAFRLFSGGDDSREMTNSSRAFDQYLHLPVGWLGWALRFKSTRFDWQLSPLLHLLSFSILVTSTFFISLIQIKLMTNLSVAIITPMHVIKSCLYCLDFVPW